LLRTHLRASLPEYMVPSAFVVLECFPLNANGKLDRRALPPPEPNTDVTPHHESPQGEVEETIARIWRELLHVDCIDRQGNFFELGGDSILAMQVRVRIRSSLSVEIPMSALFECPTLEQLSIQVADLWQARLIDRLANGGSEVKELLERVTSMSEGKVQELLRKLRMEGRP